MEDSELKAHRYFVSGIEQTIRLANREVINPLVVPFTEERVMAFAVEVAKLRGAYLKAALEVGQSKKTAPGQLKALREAFEEARDAFTALMTAVERGYVDLPESGR